MNISFHRNFKKQYSQQTKKVQAAFDIRLGYFLADEFDPLLNNHPLRGSYEGYRSINISGDIRAIYKRLTPKDVVFVVIGTHSKLYK